MWSQGGVIRRVFRFESEKEHVIQAVLTWFPSDDPADAPLQQDDTELVERSTYHGGPGEGAKRKKEDMDVDGRHGIGAAKKRISTWNSKSRTYATQLGNFPQAKSYQPQTLGGSGPLTSEDEEDPTPQGRARALVVFLKTRAHIYFLSGKSYVIHIPFEIQHAMPSPRGLMLQIKAPPLSSISKPASKSSSFASTSSLNILPSARPDFPRLYSLTDPLADLGMAITSNGNAMDPNEELIFISPNSELDSSPYTLDPTGSKTFLSSEIIFAVTLNHHKGEITIWFARYIPQETANSSHKRSSSGIATARRRSSFGPTTGVTTPVAGGGPGAIPLAASLASSQASEDLVAEFEDKPARRTSRRVSSLVARSDLSQNVDRLAFSDMASAGSSFQQPDRGASSDDPPVDDLLNDLNMMGLGLGLGNMGLSDGNRLRNEVLFTKLESFTYDIKPRTQNIGGERNRPMQSLAAGDASRLPKVFTLLAPSTVIARESNAFGHSDQKVVLCIFNKNDDSLLQLTFSLRAHTVVTSPRTLSSAASFSKRRVSGKADTKMYTPSISDIYRHKNVADAVKISDGGVSRVLMLSKLTGELTMYSPWSPEMPLVLPTTLARWSPNLVGGSLKKMKGSVSRTLNTSPERYLALEYAEEGGKVTVLDEKQIGHRIAIQLAPREAVVKLALEAVKTVLAAMVSITSGEAVGVAWMEVSRSGLVMEEEKFSRRRDSTVSVGEETPQRQDEWRTFLVTILSLGVPYIPEKPRERAKKGRTFSRTASMVATLEWEEMQNDEGEWGPGAEYLRSPAWEWMVEEQEDIGQRKSQQLPSSYTPSQSRFKNFGDSSGERRKNTMMLDSISRARKFVASKAGKKLQEHLLFGSKDPEIKKIGLALLLISLHLVREELKMDITMEMAVRRMTPLLAQLARWLGWQGWIDAYSVEDVEVDDWAFDECKEIFCLSYRVYSNTVIAKITLHAVSSQPYPPPSIYEWFINTLEGRCSSSFLSLQDIVTPTPSSPIPGSRHRNPYTPPPHISTSNVPPSVNLTKSIYAKLTPRTKLLTELYATLITPGKTYDDVVALMVKKKMTAAGLEKLPEGVALPLREAIARCQEHPPTTLGPHALDLVGRKDIKMLVTFGKVRKEISKWQTVRSGAYPD